MKKLILDVNNFTTFLVIHGDTFSSYPRLFGGTYDMRLFNRKQEWRSKLLYVHGFYQTLSVYEA